MQRAIPKNPKYEDIGPTLDTGASMSKYLKRMEELRETLNYPIAMLSRSINFETPEMLAFRNKPGQIIIVYDEDERLAPRAATTLVQRGYANLYLLSGGLKVAWKRFPEGLIVGEMPLSVRQALKLKTRDRSSGGTTGIHNRASSASSSKHNCLPGALSSAPSFGTRVVTPTLYCKPGSRDTADGLEDFLSEDIVKLTLQLENGMDDG
ncbi:centrosomal protein CEP41 [Paragonimus westermani]|uniref:Centrosomal protein CEP41 n=1 Tax=Paragonimus westermani TaxID=34504 RepID=A0A5J4NPR8_9TREM|nr:centrosomal protein CEP41 [Paragonimus westermani]